MPKEFVIKFLDTIAIQKMNRLHWHLVDSEGWRLEIKKYPKLTQVGQDQPASYPDEDPTNHAVKVHYHYGTFHGGGFYTQADIKEIVAHAEKLHITIMPEIEFPAHAMVMLTAYPEFSTTGAAPTAKSNISGALVNVDEKSLNFLRDILDETMELFPGKWIHFGGDEAPKDQWKKSEFVQSRIKELGLKDENAMQSWLFTQMAEHIAKKGRVAVGWEEITHGGTPKNAVVMPWLSMGTAAKVANEGNPVILCPVGPLCLRLLPDQRPHRQPGPLQGPHHPALGLQLQLRPPQRLSRQEGQPLGCPGPALDRAHAEARERRIPGLPPRRRPCRNHLDPRRRQGLQKLPAAPHHPCEAPRRHEGELPQAGTRPTRDLVA